MNSIINYTRLSYLGDRVKAGIASKQEKDEFMLMLFQNRSITKKQYEDYIGNRNSEDVVNAALSIGAVVLIGYLLKEMFSRK